MNEQYFNGNAWMNNILMAMHEQLHFNTNAWTMLPIATECMSNTSIAMTEWAILQYSNQYNVQS